MAANPSPSPDLLSYENELWQKGHKVVAGTDEAGRGPLAGPLVAAAVVFSPYYVLPEKAPKIGDSKALTAKQREIALEFLQHQALALSWAIKSPQVVDEIGPLKASMLAMAEALAALWPLGPDHALIDGPFKPALSYPASAIIKGDSKSLSIGAASIVAKVVRDRLMAIAHRYYPMYGFDRNQGYGTKVHREALKINGASPYHRLSYKGVLPIQGGFAFA